MTLTPCFLFAAVIFSVSEVAASLPTSVRLQRDVLFVEKIGKSKHFYSAVVTVGQPAQEFHVTFDLGGGTTILPSTSCRSKACLARRHYDKWASDTAVDIQADGRLVKPGLPKVLERIAGRDKGTLESMSVELGTGKVVGNFVRDQFCIGAQGTNPGSPQRCFPLAFLMAYEMADVPYEAEPYDGTIGLGLDGMSVSPQFNFLRGLTKNPQATLPGTFGLYLGLDEADGEITFGSHNANKISNPLEWVAIAEPGEGRWQVAISAIRIGNTTLKACNDGGCRAAIDLTASLLSVPSQLSHSMEESLESLFMPSGYGDGCQISMMPDMQLVLKNNVTLTLPAEDYVRQTSKSRSEGILSGPPLRTCKPQLAKHDFEDESVKKMFVMGESVLRRYYTIFDADSLQVGFSLAVGHKTNKATALPPKLEAGAGKEWLNAQDDEEDGQDRGKTPVILLMQVRLSRSKTIS
jgi:hypothetical protein